MPTLEAGDHTRDRSGSSLVSEAVRCAGRWHEGQRRASEDAPYITHPIEVARLLRDSGASDEVVAAGVLHDVLEKTAATPAELEARFGGRIARLVRTVSDSGGETAFGVRKRDLRARVERGGDDAALILAADVISKLRELQRRAQEDRERFGAETSDRNVHARLDHYVRSARMLRRRAAGHRLVTLLDQELAAYFTRSGAG